MFGFLREQDDVSVRAHLDSENINHLLSVNRALCRINLLPVTRVLVDTWMLTVKLFYKTSKCA